jgi:hypothetical protein
VPAIPLGITPSTPPRPAHPPSLKGCWRAIRTAWQISYD